jgi:O-antigen biosynthesis protein WbqP
MSPYRGKRALDLLVAGSAGVLFAPVLAAVTIAVWLEDGGPPLFWQPRIGRGREPFTILKFRTLRDSNVTNYPSSSMYAAAT